MNLKLCCWAMGVSLLLTASAVLVAADDSARLDESPPQPIATIRLTGLQRVLNDIRDLAQDADRPGISVVIDRILEIGNQLQGIDRRRAVSLEVFLDAEPAASGTPETPPQVRVCFPLTDLAELQLTTDRLGWSWSKDTQDRYRIARRNERELFAIVQTNADQQQWVIVSENQSLVGLTTSATDSVDVAALPDLTFTIRFDRLSPVRRQQALDKLHQDAQRDRQRRDEESDAQYQLRLDLQAMMEQGLELVLTETTQVQFRGNLLPTTAGGVHGLEVEADWSVRSDGRLAAFLPSLAPQSVQLPRATAPGAALRANAAISLPARLTELLLRGVELGRAKVTNDLVSLPQDVQQQVLGMFDTFAATVGERTEELCVQFVPADGHLALLAGVRLEEGNELAQALPLILQEATKSPRVHSVDVDFTTIRGAAFHRVRGNPLRKVDEYLYGPGAILLTGATQDALWVMIGGNQVDELCEPLLERGDTSLQSVPLVDIEWHAKPWLPIAAVAPRTQQAAEVLQSALSAEEHDAIRGKLHVRKAGISASVSVDRPFVTLFVRRIPKPGQ